MDEIDSLEEVKIQKPKRTLNELQKATTTANLAKGRAVRDAKRQAKKEVDDIKKEQDKARLTAIVEQKANKMATKQAKKETMLKQLIGVTDSETEEEVETRIFKKPKKKKIIYREESDSEEEVVISRKKRPEAHVTPPQITAPEPLPIRVPPILFY